MCFNSAKQSVEKFSKGTIFPSEKHFLSNFKCLQRHFYFCEGMIGEAGF